MKYVLIRNGVVADTIVASAKFIADLENAADWTAVAPQEVVASTYNRYTYADFVEALTDSGAARKIIIAKKTDAGADLEVFMEIARSRGIVDFNNATTLMRLNGLVPSMLTQAQADEITGE